MIDNGARPLGQLRRHLSAFEAHRHWNRRGRRLSPRKRQIAGRRTPAPAANDGGIGELANWRIGLRREAEAEGGARTGGLVDRDLPAVCDCIVFSQGSICPDILALN